MLKKKISPNKITAKCVKICPVPLWDIKQPGKYESVPWVPYAQNRRFAVFNGCGSASGVAASGAIVLDTETGLVWSQDANLSGPMNWLDANTYCRELELCNHMGWRLPTVEELSSLVDPSQSPLALPVGHPFSNVQFGAGINAYWTSTNSENPTGAAWFVNMWRGAGVHLAGLANKTSMGYVWPVRGGKSGQNWNW